jgi:hypothetical protein
MSKVAIVEIRKQLVGIKVTQPFNVVIPTTRGNFCCTQHKFCHKWNINWICNKLGLWIGRGFDEKEFE